MKIMIIDFTRHNPWGTNDYVTQYYVNGKRMRKDRYFDFEYWLGNNYRWDYTDTYTKVKNGITRDYTVMYFKDKED